ncbi:hypothetical protein NVP1177O_65 [Vibrio phage 1.177.O._10N.286.45.E10]|nr:hypothetical protein NVP1177O_65 [Vibrio phage 1.177.O._10N.286.45.E10]
MKNQDTPAMPLVDSGFGQYKPEVFGGLTKLEMFAMNAPDCPKNFRSNYENKNFNNDSIVRRIDLGYNPECQCNEWTSELTIKGEIELQKKWRYAYAKAMLED